MERHVLNASGQAGQADDQPAVRALDLDGAVREEIAERADLFKELLAEHRLGEGVERVVRELRHVGHLAEAVELLRARGRALLDAPLHALLDAVHADGRVAHARAARIVLECRERDPHDHRVVDGERCDDPVERMRSVCKLQREANEGRGALARACERRQSGRTLDSLTDGR